jgi:hypothetical protein
MVIDVAIIATRIARRGWDADSVAPRQAGVGDHLNNLPASQ